MGSGGETSHHRLREAQVVVLLHNQWLLIYCTYLTPVLTDSRPDAVTAPADPARRPLLADLP